MRSVGVMLVWVVAVWAPGGLAQRAPCYECEMYKDTHPNSNPYNAIRSHCVYPCECGTVPDCPPGVPVIMDGCECCWQCARQHGESCNGATLCDASKSLTCVYNSTADPTGTCQEPRPYKCIVNNQTYEDGESFKPDCRTQCTCLNGTYACVSLCPGESLPPSEQCHHPHLVAVPGQCCREWMCDTAPEKVVGPPECERLSGRWSPCSVQTCGSGVSVRWSNDNASCQSINQTRLCQIRPCTDPRLLHTDDQKAQDKESRRKARKHHIRRGHTCKATQRHVQSVRLRAGWCISERRYRPKFCGDCAGRCCGVHASTTLTVAFLCPLHANTDLLAVSRSRRRDAPGSAFLARLGAWSATTSRVPSVYDMMDEGQPGGEDAVLKYPAASDEDDVLSYDYSYDGGRDDASPTRRKKSFDRDNLTVEGDEEYKQIKADNYEVVHHQVEWIVRCKCSHTCDIPDTRYKTQGAAPEASREPLIVPLT
ncbi:CCN family member 2-like [Penaeus japonicus]|uniref:CCN family member 2-like n=1 Tax=Penaeus japonicus TaxID=27405 RepID=UPI001C712AE9|nr:CCN family member 2-like [Penaeus japonicus]